MDVVKVEAHHGKRNGGTHIFSQIDIAYFFLHDICVVI